MTAVNETIVEACVRLTGACELCEDTGTVVLCHDPDCREHKSCHHVAGEVPCTECSDR